MELAKRPRIRRLFGRLSSVRWFRCCSLSAEKNGNKCNEMIESILLHVRSYYLLNSCMSVEIPSKFASTKSALLNISERGIDALEVAVSTAITSSTRITPFRCNRTIDLNMLPKLWLRNKCLLNRIYRSGSSIGTNPPMIKRRVFFGALSTSSTSLICRCTGEYMWLMRYRISVPDG